MLGHALAGEGEWSPQGGILSLNSTLCASTPREKADSVDEQQAPKYISLREASTWPESYQDRQRPSEARAIHDHTGSLSDLSYLGTAAYAPSSDSPRYAGQVSSMVCSARTCCLCATQYVHLSTLTSGLWLPRVCELCPGDNKDSPE